ASEVFTEGLRKGIAPTEDRCRALREARAPEDVKALRSFLGVVQFSARFIPDLNTVTDPLWQLTCGVLRKLQRVCKTTPELDPEPYVGKAAWWLFRSSNNDDEELTSLRSHAKIVCPPVPRPSGLLPFDLNASLQGAQPVSLDSAESSRGWEGTETAPTRTTRKDRFF
ncbi:Transposon Tf2-9 poly, partial [Brachionus plicatilis]